MHETAKHAEALRIGRIDDPSEDNIVGRERKQIFESPAASSRWGVHPIDGVNQVRHIRFQIYRPEDCAEPVSMKRITVLLVDDNGGVRKTFREILERKDDLEVVGEAKNGREAVALVQKLLPALVLMDMAMPLLNGAQAARQILEAVPATKVLMLSAHTDDEYVQEAVNSGAMGYLVKQTSAERVCTAIREVLKGRTYFSPSIPRRLHKPNRKM